jgi:hypothetical protein
MKINKSWNIVALYLFAMFFIAGCSKNESPSVEPAIGATGLPKECEEFIRTLANCTAKFEKNSEEEMYAELVEAYKKKPGALEPQECKKGLDDLKYYKTLAC